MNKRQFGLLMALCSGIQWGLIMPSFPLFLESLGASIALIGVVAASRTLPQFFLRIPFAAISDRLRGGKKLFMVFGLVFQIIPPFLFLVVTNAYQVLVLFLVDGIAEAAFWPSLFAHISELGTRKKSGEAMGALTFGWGSGFTIGTALVGVLLSEWGFLGTYLFAASVGVLTLPFLLSTFETTTENLGVHEMQSKALENPFKGFKTLITNPSILFAISSGILDAALLSTIQTFLPLYALRSGLTEIQIGALFTANSLASSMVQYPVGRLSDRANRRVMLVAGTALSSFVVFLVPFTMNFHILILLLALAGLGTGLGRPTRLAFMLDAAPHQKALSTALTTSFVQMSQSVFPTILGIVGSRKGLNISFLAVSGFSMIVLGGVALVTEKMIRKKREPHLFEL